MTTKPSLIAYTVKDRGERKAIWTKIGAAWPHQEKGGFTIELAALPLDGRIVLIEPKAEEPASFEDAAQEGAR